MYLKMLLKKFELFLSLLVAVIAVIFIFYLGVGIYAPKVGKMNDFSTPNPTTNLTGRDTVNVKIEARMSNNGNSNPRLVDVICFFGIDPNKTLRKTIQNAANKGIPAEIDGKKISFSNINPKANYNVLQDIRIPIGVTVCLSLN